MNDQDKLRAALEAMLSKDMTHGREMWPEVQQARATLAVLGEKRGAVASPTLPVVIRGKVYDVPIPVQLRIVALEDALEARGTKPFCYVRTLNGAPDWAEDCVCEEAGVVLQYHDEAEGYGEMPLYAHPTAPKQPEAPDEVANLVDRGRAEVDRDTLGTGFLVRGCYVHPSLVEVLVTKNEAQGEAVADRNRLVGSVLDGWSMLPNDLKAEVRDCYLGGCLDKLSDWMENEQPAPSRTAASKQVEGVDVGVIERRGSGGLFVHWQNIDAESLFPGYPAGTRVLAMPALTAAQQQEHQENGHG